MKYKFLSHTADIKFQAFGKTIEEAFENCSLALINIITKDKIKSRNNKKILINVKGNDYESLLVNFLEKFLFLFETKGFLLSKINKIKITNKTTKSMINKTDKFNDKNLKVNNINNKFSYVLECEVIGDKLDKNNYEISNHVKAITYNDMFVKKEKNKFITQVVVDV